MASSSSPTEVPETLLKMALQLTPQKDRSELLGRMLEKEDEEQEAGVNSILDDLMRELPVEDQAKGKGRGKAATGAKKVVPVPAKPKMTAKIAAGTQKRPNTSAAAEPKSKRVKKEAEDVPKKKPQPKKALESSDDEEDEEEDDVIDLEESSEGNEYDSDELEDEEEDSSDEDEDEEEEANVPAGGNLKNAKKIAILAKDLTTPVRAIMLSQCKQCQLAQKEVVNPISSVATDELFLNLAVCKSCIEGNVQQLNLHKRYFGGQKPVKLFPQAVETKKPKKKKYIPEGDDYKCTSGRFHVTIGQCGTCAARQRALSAELFLAKGPGRTRLCAYAQCLTCLGGNKQLQSAYWRFWSIFADKAGKGGKGNKK
jgi:hypothetical protein